MMLVDGLVRVSKVRGRSGPSFISPTQQADKIEAYCRLHGYELATMHEELDQSGGRKDRPKLEAAVTRIESGQTGGLIVAKLDRFGRTLVHGLATIERIQAAGGVFASVTDQFDTSTAHGRFVLKVMLSLAELELDRVRDNFEDARRRAVARGIHPCAVPPVGYMRREHDSGLRPHPVFGPMVAEIFRRAADGEPWVRLAEWATSRGLRTAWGNAHWTGRAIKALTRNTVYLGVAHHGEFTNPDAHEPLVDADTWRRAQRHGVKVASRSQRPALLAGLLRCGSCRYVMGSFIVRDRYRQYRCHTTHSRGTCPAPARSTTVGGIEELVVERFFAAVGDVRALGTPSAHEHLAELEAAAQQTEQALAAYRDDPEIIVTLGMARYKRGLTELAQAADHAAAELAAERDRVQLALPVPASELRHAWPQLDVAEQRKLIALAFDAVFLVPGEGPLEQRLHFCTRGEAPQDMPRKGRGGARTIAPFIPPLPETQAA